MKSAYELAMERLVQADPQATAPLSAEQKEALAEIDRKYQARLAEREIFLQRQLAEARARRDAEALDQLETQLRNERARFAEEREAAKDKVRHGAA
jgi:hypothetical protein